MIKQQKNPISENSMPSDQKITDHLGFNKEGIIYLIGILLCMVGPILMLFVGSLGLALNILGLILLLITIYMNFKEKSSFGVKIGGLVMKFFVFISFLVIALIIVFVTYLNN